MVKNLPIRKKLPHTVPSWVPVGSKYFITIVAKNRESNPLGTPIIAKSLLESIRFYDEKQNWYIWQAVIMPDHIHLIASFPRASGLQKTIQLWKGYLSKTLGIKFQDGFFEHRLRNDEEYCKKMDYIRNNPVEKGLVENIEDYPYFYSNNVRLP